MSDTPAEMDAEGLAKRLAKRLETRAKWRTHAEAIDALDMKAAALLRSQAEEIARLRDRLGIWQDEDGSIHDEIDRLRFELSATLWQKHSISDARDTLTRQLQEAVEERDRLEGKVLTLKSILRLRGQHPYDCPARTIRFGCPGRCTCGLDAALTNRSTDDE